MGSNGSCRSNVGLMGLMGLIGLIGLMGLIGLIGVLGVIGDLVLCQSPNSMVASSLELSMVTSSVSFRHSSPSATITVKV